MSQMRRIEPIIERLHGLHPRLIDLSLDRLLRLLAELGHPERGLPPVIHVAGTNGKGSTCAFLRAMGEAAGWRVHVYTSPHLVRFNERFRVAGRIVSDAALAEALETIERVNQGQAITVFEVITAAAFQLFAGEAGELCVLEVGLGGCGDATNVIRPAACAVTSISLDHRDLLGDTLEAIAAEKAGIFKHGVPAVTGVQPAAVLAVLDRAAAAAGTAVLARGREWRIEAAGAGLRFEDAAGAVELPSPALAGPHQVDNAGIAVAALRARGVVPVSAYAGIGRAEWPARMQRLRGRLAAMVPAGWEVWLDGGHNPGAGVALAEALRAWADRPVHLVVGMKQSKDASMFLAPLVPGAASVWAVREAEQHLALAVEAIVAASGGVARPGPTVSAALRGLAAADRNGLPARVLICGSLYLAGEVLKQDGDRKAGGGGFT
ncbi:MAG: folylpolyglutamate synthase/dihydrofolate synthase family protein [Acetobacteraceae bacterium]